MLSNKRIQERVFKNSLETCDYISGYENKHSVITVKCRIHNYQFITKYENLARDGRPHNICPLCKQKAREERNKIHTVELQCAYCNKTFTRAKSKLENSKSGLYFCCREHKDLAQRLDSGEKFNKIRPEQYGIILTDYREAAFRKYKHKCAICNWDEDEDVLEVHHINYNHQDNNIDNLIILCPICHKKLTTGKYQIKDNKIIKI